VVPSARRESAADQIIWTRHKVRLQSRRERVSRTIVAELLGFRMLLATIAEVTVHLIHGPLVVFRCADGLVGR